MTSRTTPTTFSFMKLMYSPVNQAVLCLASGKETWALGRWPCKSWQNTTTNGASGGGDLVDLVIRARGDDP